MKHSTEAKFLIVLQLAQNKSLFRIDLKKKKKKNSDSYIHEIVLIQILLKSIAQHLTVSSFKFLITETEVSDCFHFNSTSYSGKQASKSELKWCLCYQKFQSIPTHCPHIGISAIPFCDNLNASVLSKTAHNYYMPCRGVHLFPMYFIPKKLAFCKHMKPTSQVWISRNKPYNIPCTMCRQ